MRDTVVKRRNPIFDLGAANIAADGRIGVARNDTEPRLPDQLRADRNNRRRASVNVIAAGADTGPTEPETH